ncbi:MAG: hypothetical protein HQL57_04575 [Magnetococcales bacterium]|nr:hypothetical protein [Magnetococcales bacterium]MBF0156438.1 hypothetical protein [Magnetococcales bacterium]
MSKSPVIDGELRVPVTVFLTLEQLELISRSAMCREERHGGRTRVSVSEVLRELIEDNRKPFEREIMGCVPPSLSLPRQP